jgi:hypothetical protein
MRRPNASPIALLSSNAEPFSRRRIQTADAPCAKAIAIAVHGDGHGTIRKHRPHDFDLLKRRTRVVVDRQRRHAADRADRPSGTRDRHPDAEVGHGAAPQCEAAFLYHWGSLQSAFGGCGLRRPDREDERWRLGERVDGCTCAQREGQSRRSDLHCFPRERCSDPATSAPCCNDGACTNSTRAV